MLDARYSLKMGKVADLHGLTTKHVRMSAIPVAQYLRLTLIINCIFNEGKFPKSVQERILHPILKKVKAKEVHSIMMTPILAKIMDRIIHTHQRTATPERLHPMQFGFVEQCSGLHAAFLLTDAIADARDHSETMYVVSLDVEKAFDTVRHASLLDKLHRMGRID